MKILKSATMPNGTEIQLEDWSEKYPSVFGLMIGAYPVVKRTSQFSRVKYGENFRLSLSCYNTNEDVLKDFEALIKGEKRLEDLSKQFYDTKKAMWLLGI